MMAAETSVIPGSVSVGPQPILRTEKLVKIYGRRAVVNGVDIQLSDCSGRMEPGRRRVFT
jgi:hypothetical protein